MMLPTHALAGMLLALPVALVAPELGSVALVAGFVGGGLPDLDMYAGHRKTLHFPVYYPGLAAVAVTVAALAPGAVTVGLAVALLGASLHSVADAFGGGLELRPWEGTSDRAVYDHHNGRWLAPRRWVRYDGAPEDLLLSVVLAAPLLATVEGPPRRAVVAALAVAAGYAAVRRRLPALADRLAARLVDRLPGRLLAAVPGRYLGVVEEGRAAPGES